MVEPAYQELLKSDIPHISKDGVHVAVIAGESYGASVSAHLLNNYCTRLASSPGPSFHRERSLGNMLLYRHNHKSRRFFLTTSYTLQSPVRTRTPTMYLDFKLDSGATMSQPVTEGWNGFIYVLKGVGKFGGGNSWTESDAHHTLVLGPGDHIQATNTVSSLLLA